MQYFVIGDKDTVLGFSLACVDGAVVRTGEEALAVFQKVIADENIGIIIITEKIASLIKSELEAYLFTRDFPLVIEIPDREGAQKDRVEIRDLVNAAIGIKL